MPGRGRAWAPWKSDTTLDSGAVSPADARRRCHPVPPSPRASSSRTALAGQTGPSWRSTRGRVSEALGQRRRRRDRTGLAWPPSLRREATPTGARRVVAIGVGAASGTDGCPFGVPYFERVLSSRQARDLVRLCSVVPPPLSSLLSTAPWVLRLRGAMCEALMFGTPVLDVSGISPNWIRTLK